MVSYVDMGFAIQRRLMELGYVRRAFLFVDVSKDIPEEILDCLNIKDDRLTQTVVSIKPHRYQELYDLLGCGDAK